MITVKVGQLPGSINEYALNDGATVSDALTAASLSPRGFEIRVNGAVADPSRRLFSDALVLLVKQVKGNMPAASFITVKVGKLPGQIKEIALNGGRTVADAIGAAGLEMKDGQEIRVDGVPADKGKNLRANQTVLIVKKVKGNMPDGYITVKVGKLPGGVTEIALNGGRTVADALGAAGLDGAISGHEIRVNGAVSDRARNLRQGDLVLLVRQVKGNG